MSAKRALVVDDSKSARVVLSRMLEKYGIAVDTADSAESALDYLKRERPDVVFMDHLMPGMDGLEAVKLIKADPATASLPIMMYTSQEGELYVGQARALGAMGVLPKTVRPIDVTKVLYQLHLLPDRRDTSPPSLKPVDSNGEEAAAEGPVTLDPQLRGAIEAMLKEQSLELRRFMVATLEGQSRRLVAELRESSGKAAAAPAEGEEIIVPPRPMAPAEPPARPWGSLAAGIAVVAALVAAGWMYWQNRQTAAEVEQARVRLEAEAAALKETLAQVRDSNAALTAAATGSTAPAEPRVEVIPVPYGEAPLTPERLDRLRTLVAQLEEQDFRGTVRVETVAGRFCLAGSAEAGFSPAPPGTAAGECDYRGNPFDESLTGAARQPVAFANLAATVRQRTGGAISLALVQGAREHVVAPYPPLDMATAGQWNEAAGANNRLEVSVLPE